MARVFSPSGETEFFEVTELQAGFEKELKTGERVTIAPGARDASFLREAPVRAELSQLYEQFRDRVLNPPDPFQSPAPFFQCPAWISNGDAELEAGPATGVTASPNPPEIIVAINQQQLSVARWNNQTASNPGTLSGASYVFSGIPFGGGLSSPLLYGPYNYYGPPISVPLSLSASISVAWWNPGITSNFQNIRLQINWFQFPLIIYDTGYFTCNNIPANNSATPLPIATVTADFSRGQYTCNGTLSNFVFTNLYP